MRANYFTILLVFLFAFPTYSYSQLTFGAKAGVGISNFSISNQLNEAYTLDSRFVFHGGFLTNYSFGGKFGVQTELIFMQRGGTFKERELKGFVDENGTQHNGNLYFDERLSYLDIPVLLQYRFRGRTISPYLMAGPSFGFALGGKLIIGFDSPTFQQESEPEDINFGNASADYYKGFNMDLTMGGGLELELDAGALFVEVRYGLGLTNMDPQGRAIANIANRIATLSLGYKFGGGGW